MRNRSRSYRKHWGRLVEMHGALCFYCREEIATTIDHITPWSWDFDDEITNLVPACPLCNMLASDKLFESVEHKRQYILNRRRNRKNRRCICTVCLLPYGYRTMSPSLFLCAECYDKEYETKYSHRPSWAQWLTELTDADIDPSAHRYALQCAGPACKAQAKRQFVYHLVAYYEAHPLH